MGAKGPMKCHYETLSVARDASDDEIKKSYRKLALKWHPDKNPENIDECTQVFLQLQTAYEVLSDPQERAWYDNHREAILRGGLGHGEHYDDKSLNVFEYFNTSCYSGFGDNENGFYAVYSQVFETISQEDLEFHDDDDSDEEAPPFGDSRSDYEEVVHNFYAFWESYCTKKSYVWMEKYDTREAPHRQVRRAMEKENKKLRDKARKERNDEVRALVAFVRKRDKRVQAQKKKLEEKAVQAAAKAAERKLRAQKERMKQLENYKEASWSASAAREDDLKALEAKLAEQFGDDVEQSGSSEEGDQDVEGEDVDELYDDLFCVACNRAFRSEKQYANHEGSKKHRDNVSRLKAELAEEEEILEGLGLGSNSHIGDQEEKIDENATPKTKLSKKQKKKRKQQQQLIEAPDEDDPILEEIESINLEDKERKGNLQSGHVETEEPPTKPPVDMLGNGLPSDVQSLDGSENGGSGSEATGVTENDDPTEAVHTEDLKETPAEVTETNQGESLPVPDVIVEGACKATDPSEIKATNETKVTTKRSKKGKPNTQETKGVESSCNTCRATFPSRSRLFEHLNETGHALRLDQVDAFAASEETGKKGKKAKRKGKR